MLLVIARAIERDLATDAQRRSCLAASALRLASPLHGVRAALELAADNLPLGPTHSAIIDRTLTEVDRTERFINEMLADLLAAREQLDALFASIPTAIMLIDSSGRILKLNQAELELTGVRSADELRRASMATPPLIELAYYSGEPVPNEERPFQRCMRGETFSNIPMRMTNVRGEQFDILVSGRPVEATESGRQVSVMAARDVTEVTRSRERFLHMISHEIRNPLTTAKGLVQLCKRRADASDVSSDFTTLLELADEELSHIACLAREVAKSEAAVVLQRPVQLEPMDALAVVRAAVEARAAAHESHRIVADLPADGSLIVHGDRTRLKEILDNLVSNAAKYSPTGTVIVIRVESSNGDLVVTVEDEGIGIPADKLDAVFKPFYRANNWGDRDPGGSGLGLYVSREIARAHGGELWAESRPEGGTIVRLKLPLIAATDEVAAGEAGR